MQEVSGSNPCKGSCFFVRNPLNAVKKTAKQEFTAFNAFNAKRCGRFEAKKVLVPTPLEGEGGNYILNWVSFVQSILADRYIHRRELRLVSLESLSSVEYGIKKVFTDFRF